MRTGERIWTAISARLKQQVLGDFIFVVTLDGQVVCLSSTESRALGEPAAFEDPDDHQGVSIGQDRCWRVEKFMSPSTGEIWPVNPMAKSLKVWIWVGRIMPPAVADGTIYFFDDDDSLIRASVTTRL